MFCIPKYYALMLVLSTLVQYIVTVFISKGRQIIPSNLGLPFRLLRCRSNFKRAHMLSRINVLTTPAVNLTIFVSFIPCFDKFWNNYADSKKVKWSFLQDDNSLILVYYPNGHPYRNLKHGIKCNNSQLSLPSDVRLCFHVSKHRSRFPLWNTAFVSFRWVERFVNFES